jgi:hypothetical protein
MALRIDAQGAREAPVVTAAEELAQRLLDRFGYIVFHVRNPLPIGHIFHKMATTEREIIMEAKFIVIAAATKADEDEQLEYLGALRRPEDLLNPYYYKALAE